MLDMKLSQLAEQYRDKTLHDLIYEMPIDELQCLVGVANERYRWLEFMESIGETELGGTSE